MLLLAPAPQARGEEFRSEASVGLRSEFNDNPNLVLRDDAEAVTGLIADAAFKASIGGPSWQLDVEPRVVARRYTGQSDLDSRDVLLQASLARSVERGQYAVTASYRREYTLTSQFAATGAVDANVPREAYSAGVSAVRVVSERVRLQGGLSSDDVSYTDGADIGLFDYRYWLAAGSAILAVSPRTSVSLVGRTARLDTDVTGVSSREYSAGLGLDHAWDESWSLSLDAGPTLGTSDGRGRDTGLSYRASLNGAWERSGFALGAQRTLSPDSSQGRLQVYDSFSASYRYRIRESLAATAYLRNDRYSDQGRVPAGLQESYGTSSAGLRLDGEIGSSMSWRVLCAHVVREGSGSPRSNSVSVGFSWRGFARSNSF